MFSIESSGEVTSGKAILSRTVVANVKPHYTQEYNSETGEDISGQRFFCRYVLKGHLSLHIPMPNKNVGFSH